MQDFTITTKDKAAFDAFTQGTPDKPAPLFAALQGRRIEFAAQNAEHHWEVPPEDTEELNEIGLRIKTPGEGLTTTYSAWLRVWDDEPVEVELPKGVTLSPRGIGGKGFPMPEPTPPEAIPEGVKVPLPDVISDRQFAHGLAQFGYISQEEAKAWVGPGTLPKAISDFIGSLPPDKKFDYEMVLIGATMFKRTDPLADTFGNAVGLSSVELDQFWMICAGL